MRAVVAGILVCGVVTSVPPASAQRCDPALEVTITFDENDDHPDGKKCDVAKVDPDPVVVCAFDSTITWKFVNDCDRDLKPKIGKRKSIYPKHSRQEPLEKANDFKPSPDKVTSGSSATLSAEKVSNSAKDGRYKYDIAGDIDTDPEIDVRRGGKGTSPLPVPPRPAPSPSPSPSGPR